MRMWAFGAAAAAGLASGAQAQSMNAEVFHAKAVALQNKGPMAIFSGDVKLLMNEGKAAGQHARELRIAAAKAGQKPRYCPPEGKQSMNSNEFMARLGAIPQAERAQMDMTEAMTRILAVKFPCPKS